MLPQLREPSIKKDAHSGKFYEPRADADDTSRRATDHANRMARQTEKHMARLGRATMGSFTRSRRRRHA